MPRNQSGTSLLLVILAVALAAASLGALALTSAGAAAQREAATERALAQAREALISHASDRPIDARVGPGYLPCPDTDDDGWAESTCGSLSGHLGQEERLGRLPWKTLGLPDLRDGSGERLWYAVSSRHKGLLNCAASRACIDMTPASALGTITVRDTSGLALHDGTLADPARAWLGGAAAVVIAPGAALRRLQGLEQRRECAPGDCDVRGRCLTDPPRRAAACDPRNYLDAAPFEDNADFVDRNDALARAGNGNGFVQGPLRVDGELVVNDRLLAIGFPELMSRVMARIGLEVAACVRGNDPDIEPCGAGGHYGHIAETGFAPAPACNASAADPAWWAHWRPFVLYARAGAGGMAVVDGAGRTLASGQRFAVLVTQRAGDCAAGRVTCEADGCVRVDNPVRTRERLDALVARP